MQIIATYRDNRILLSMANGRAAARPYVVGEECPMSMTPSAACAMYATCSPGSRRILLNWCDIAVMRRDVWHSRSPWSSALLLAVMTFSCRATQLVSTLLLFPRSPRRAQRPAMPPADVFGRPPLSSLLPRGHRLQAQREKHEGEVPEWVLAKSGAPDGRSDSQNACLLRTRGRIRRAQIGSLE